MKEKFNPLIIAWKKGECTKRNYIALKENLKGEAIDIYLCGKGAAKQQTSFLLIFHYVCVLVHAENFWMSN